MGANAHPLKDHLEEMLNDASIDRVMAIDTNWKIIAWNHTSAILSGIKKQEAEGRDLMEIFPQLKADKEIMEAFRHALEGKTSFLPARPGAFNPDHYENHFIPLKDEE